MEGRDSRRAGRRPRGRALGQRDFLASDFIAGTSCPPLLKAAKAEGVTICVNLSPCRFNRTPSLAQYQSVNSPDEPLSSLSWDEKERVWARWPMHRGAAGPPFGYSFGNRSGSRGQANYSADFSRHTPPVSPGDLKNYSLLVFKQTLEGNGDELFSVTFSPDGALVAAGSNEVVFLWTERN
jgi:WD40 repeat protein